MVAAIAVPVWTMMVGVVTVVKVVVIGMIQYLFKLEHGGKYDQLNTDQKGTIWK